MSVLRIFLEAAAISLALSVDSFIAAFSYGTSKIKIPLSSVGIISVTGSLITGLSMLAGSFVKDFIPPGFTTLLSFGILFLLGVLKLFESSSPANADKDNSHSISAKEALSLSAAQGCDMAVFQLRELHLFQTVEYLLVLCLGVSRKETFGLAES